MNVTRVVMRIDLCKAAAMSESIKKGQPGYDQLLTALKGINAQAAAQVASHDAITTADVNTVVDTLVVQTSRVAVKPFNGGADHMLRNSTSKPIAQAHRALVKSVSRFMPDDMKARKEVAAEQVKAWLVQLVGTVKAADQCGIRQVDPATNDLSPISVRPDGEISLGLADENDPLNDILSRATGGAPPAVIQFLSTFLDSQDHSSADGPDERIVLSSLAVTISGMDSGALKSELLKALDFEVEAATGDAAERKASLPGVDQLKIFRDNLRLAYFEEN